MSFDSALLVISQSVVSTGFGALFSFLLSGVKTSRRNLLSLAAMTVGAYACWHLALIFGDSADLRITYVLLVHVPMVLFLVLWFKVPFSLALLAHLLSYFLVAPGNILSRFLLYGSGWLGLPLPLHLVQAVALALTVPVIYLPELRYLIPPLRALTTGLKSERLTLLVILCVCFALAFAGNISLAGYDSPRVFFLSSLFVVMMIAYLVGLAIYARSLKAKEEDRLRMTAYSVQNDSLALYLESLTNYLEETSLLRHDQRHLLLMLDAYAVQGELSAIRKLVGEKISVLDASPVRVAKDNSVNAVVAMFRKRAEHLGVSLRLSGGGLDWVPMPPQDLCLVLCNALENAIEATAREESASGEVLLAASHDEATGVTVLSVRNPCSEAVAYSGDGLPASRKGAEHGYGTRSIQNIVRKRGGICEFAQADGEFVFRAAFFRPAASEPSV